MSDGTMVRLGFGLLASSEVVCLEIASIADAQIVRRIISLRGREPERAKCLSCDVSGRTSTVLRARRLEISCAKMWLRP